MEPYHKLAAAGDNAAGTKPWQAKGKQHDVSMAMQEEPIDWRDLYNMYKLYKLYEL